MIAAMTTSAAIALLLFLFPGALLGLARQLVGSLP
jgi:hypothetical protein